jgi:HEAT repeat protein/Na+/melibiose symporter-like transporter
MLRAMRLWTVEAMVATVQITLTSGAFQVGFALYLGCSDFIIGLLAAVPAFAGLLQLFASYFAHRYGDRKKLVIWCSLISRLLWIPMLLVPFTLPKADWVSMFLVLTLLSNALANISAPLWTAWISDLVPEDVRGRYFGSRNMYAGIVGTVMSIGGGAFLDSATKRHLYSEPMAFAIIFICASTFALMSFYCGWRSPDPGPSAAASDGGPNDSIETKRGALAFYAAPFADRNYRLIITYYAAFVFATAISAQFFTVYQLTYLKLNYTSFQLLGAVASVAGLASMQLWGYLADKYGNRPILMISSVLVVIAPFLWLATYPDGMSGLWSTGPGGNLIVSYSKLDIILLNTIAGISWAGLGLTQFNLMIGAAPAEKRTVYVGAISAVSGLAGGIAPIVGGRFLEATAGVHFPHVGPVRTNYHVLFIMSGAMRLACIFLLIRISEVGSNSTRYVLGQLRGSKPLQSIPHLHRLSKGVSVASRQQAAERLAQLKTPVAVDELVKALDDVALPVRERAAIALGEIGDQRAIAPLADKLADTSAGITGVAAHALGKIGTEDAYEPLAEAAHEGGMQARIAAIEALGYVADHRARELLLEASNDSTPEIAIAALRALGEREEPETVAAFVDRLEDATDPGTIAMIADALGRVGDCSALSPLISLLGRDLPPTAHRTVVNAIGSIAIGRDAVYPMLALDDYGRDETVSRILTGIQRRARGRRPHGAKIALCSAHSLEAYVAGDYQRCLLQLSTLARHTHDDGEPRAAERVIPELLRVREESSSPVSIEEVLLAVAVAQVL